VQQSHLVRRFYALGCGADSDPTRQAD